MTRRTSLTAAVLLFCSLALPAWGQQYFLYEPKPVTAEERAQGKGGVLVTEVPVQKGDTLYGISRKFSGRGMYYPQILLFNNIKDPRLIYPGNTLKVPVAQSGAGAESAPAGESAGKPKKHKAKDGTVSKSKAAVAAPVPAKQPVASSTGAASVTEISLSDLKTLDDGKPKKRTDKKKVAAQGSARDKKLKTAAIGRAEAEPSPVASEGVAGQKLFEKAVKAYRQDDFRGALDLFDRYLADNATSPLAADASLYKAECYLKLSSQ